MDSCALQGWGTARRESIEEQNALAHAMRLWAESKRANGEQRKEIEAELDSAYRKWAEAKEDRMELQRKEQERERYLRVCEM